jgi:hypothetical protein
LIKERGGVVIYGLWRLATGTKTLERSICGESSLECGGNCIARQEYRRTVDETGHSSPSIVFVDLRAFRSSYPLASILKIGSDPRFDYERHEHNTNFVILLTLEGVLFLTL